MTDFPTENHFKRLAARALDASLPRSDWTHEAHFALALWMLRHRPELSSADDLRAIIRRLNEAHGTPNTDSSGYHHTITVASLRAASALLSKHADEPLPAVLHRLMAGPCGRADWIFAHWSRDHLFSPAARRGWEEPDLAPLPC